MAWLGNVLRNIFFTEIPEDQVLQVYNNCYSDRRVICRDDGIVLYSPMEERQKYEIVLHRPATESSHMCYSLHRADNILQAESRFIIYRNTIQIIINVCKKMANIVDIQRLCDLLLLHPYWNVAHISAYLSLFDLIDHRKVKDYLNAADTETGMSPLQVAVQANNLSMVTKLIAAKCKVDHLDYNLNTVFHYAATTTESMITSLATDDYEILNNKNSSGITALHIACYNDKLECARALIKIGANVNTPASEAVGSANFPNVDSQKVQRLRNGGTPLHYSFNPEIMKLLIENECWINARNLSEQTALFTMVSEDVYENVILLLSNDADANEFMTSGYSALYVAVQNCNLKIVQVLIAFNADVNIVNVQSQSLRHATNITRENGRKILHLLHSVGTKRCASRTLDCHDGCKYDGEFNGDAPSSPLPEYSRTVLDQILYVASMGRFASKPLIRKNGGRLLCLDGGGIKGLILVQMLMEIEAVLKKPIVSCFDWIAGTSTGGILALGLATGKSLRECQTLYFRIKNNAFEGRRPYPSKPLEEALIDCFGNSTVMSIIEHPKIMITGVLGDRRPVELHLFRNYDSPNTILKMPSNKMFRDTLTPDKQLVWKVARATGAAPTYFPPFGRFLDGGLIANNPTLDAMTEICEYNLALQTAGRLEEMTPLSLVVSLGTGLLPVTAQWFDVDWRSNVFETLKLVLNLLNLIVDQATTTDGRVVDRARTWCSMIGVPYYRFNPQLRAEVPMNETDDVKLIEMMCDTKAYMHANHGQIEEMAIMLNSISEE